MILNKNFVFLLIVIFTVSGCGSLQDYTADMPEAIGGYVRLVLNERTGSFSLYYLVDPRDMIYEPLFNSRNSSTSFLTVNVDGKTHRLGRSRAFRTSIQKINGDPALVFESPYLIVNQVFSPITTTHSLFSNGVMITITIQNISDESSSVGLRFLIDTTLGEGRNHIPFITENREISRELLLSGAGDERYWVSQGKKTSLMGSIASPEGHNITPPDFVHFANWKRLSDTSWRLRYSEGRSFNKVPYSIRDSAVCYYYEPITLESGDSVTYTVFLTTEDASWYNHPRQSANRLTAAGLNTSVVNIPALEEEARIEAARDNKEPGVVVLLKLHDILDQFISGEITLNEQDLSEIEKFVDRHRN